MSTASAYNDTASNPTGSSSDSDSSLSSDLSSLGSDISGFLSSDLGSLAETGTLAGLGISQAESASSEASSLASSLGQLGAPFNTAAGETLTQLEGGAQAPGALGTEIAGQTTTANNLQGVANTYSTGQLTAAQQQQVQDYISQQQAQVNQQLAASGNIDSSAQDAAYQEIQNNAATLTQQLISGNTTMAEQAQTAVQQTYSSLLNQALSEADFGFEAQSADVSLQIQSDTQLAQSLNQLFAGIAQGLSGATSGTGSSTGAALGSAIAGITGAGAAASGASSLLSGSSSSGSDAEEDLPSTELTDSSGYTDTFSIPALGSGTSTSPLSDTLDTSDDGYSENLDEFDDTASDPFGD